VPKNSFDLSTVKVLRIYLQVVLDVYGLYATSSALKIHVIMEYINMKR